MEWGGSGGARVAEAPLGDLIQAKCANTMGNIVIVGITVPQPASDGLTFACALKASPRRVGAISHVALGLCVTFPPPTAEGDTGWVASTASVYVMTDHKFLNMRADAEEAATVPLLSPESVEFELTLGRWEEVLAPATGALRQAHHDASTTVTVDSTGQEFRRVLASSLLYRSHVMVATWIEALVQRSSNGPSNLTLPPPPPIDDRDRSAVSTATFVSASGGAGGDDGRYGEDGGDGGGDGDSGHRGVSTGVQRWKPVPANGFVQTANPKALHQPTVNLVRAKGEAPMRAPVGEPVPHACSGPQVTGEALYVADVEPPRDCLEVKYGFNFSLADPNPNHQPGSEMNILTCRYRLCSFRRRWSVQRALTLVSETLTLRPPWPSLVYGATSTIVTSLTALSKERSGSKTTRTTCLPTDW
mmetsp:Transcript_10027/g.26056  ORF Transcript_10027/g.26056 Transcript_10027/m.26056 type:complete len:417 (-) Transcript_10027:4542-5792(-)